MTATAAQARMPPSPRQPAQLQLLGSNTELLFHASQTFDIPNSISVTSSNVLIGSYGSGRPAYRQDGGNGFLDLQHRRLPRPMSSPRAWFSIQCGDLATYGPLKVNVYGFYVTGDNFTVRDCQFLNVDDGVNTAGMPTGVLVQDNYFGDMIRGCSIWGQGYDHVYIGNTMTNSTKEHLIRMSGTGVARVLIEGNNLSRPTNSKGSLELRTASFFYVTGNVVDGGTLRIGLPQGSDPYFTGWGVVQDNETTNIFANIRPGVQHVAIRDNVFNYGSGVFFNLETQGSADNRVTSDIRIDDNTLIDDAPYCKFLEADGQVEDVSVMNNLMIAPNIQWQGDGSGAIYVMESTLSGFSTISNNVWPQMPGNSQQARRLLSPTVVGQCSQRIREKQRLEQSAAKSTTTSLPTPRSAIMVSGYDITLNGTTAGALKPTAFDPGRHGACRRGKRRLAVQFELNPTDRDEFRRGRGILRRDVWAWLPLPSTPGRGLG